YIVALLMLWMVILLPFILLQLFLDFLSNNSLSTQQMTSFITNNLKGPLAKREIPIPFIGTNPFRPTPPPPPGSQPAGVARALPLSLEEKRQQTEENMKKIEEKREQSASNIQSVMNTNRIGEKTIRGTKIVTQRPVETQAGRTTSQNEETQRIVRSNIATTHVTQTQSLASTLRSQLRLKPQVQESQSLRLVSFPIPTMQDIVKYETARLKKGAITTHEMTNVRDTLQKIATPQVTSSPVEKQKYTTLKTKLTEQKTQGDVVASSILQAASVVSQTQTATGGGPSLVYPVNLPPVNPIQTVSLDDYEAVKAMWVDNYQKVDVPQLSDTQPQTRQEWIQHDINTISETISLLTSPDPQKIQQGLNEVSQILPFILMGGFSQTEVVAYLKAKLEAGKMVGELLTQKEAEDEKLIDVQNQHHEKLKTMEASAQEAIDGDETT
ncbi:MAG TPA: hypothetical protein VGT05_02985, partial [Patescibacteria group bacterium]|nr:hypothetical protein [Patescibacteria group bacterium]